jgi:hypothetical protein
MDRDHGKDAGSAVDAWLLRGSNEMAHLHSVGTKFDDRASIAPMALPMSGTFSRADLGDGQVRLRLTPDGRDDWSFEPRLMLTFSDGTSRTYAWPQVMLERASGSDVESVVSRAESVKRLDLDTSDQRGSLANKRRNNHRSL